MASNKKKKLQKFRVVVEQSNFFGTIVYAVDEASANAMAEASFLAASRDAAPPTLGDFDFRYPMPAASDPDCDAITGDFGRRQGHVD